MTPREFFNSWIGYEDKLKTEWDVFFYISQLNAMRTTWSKEQANQIEKDKAPWREEKKPPKKEMTAKQIQLMLNFISK